MAESVPAGLKPLDVDGVTASAVGTVAWAVAFVVLLLQWDSLVADGTQWWLATCGAGVVIGLLGVAYGVRRRNSIRAHSQ